MFWHLKVLLIVHGQVNDGEVSKTIRGRSRRGGARRGSPSPSLACLLSSGIPLCAPSATTLIAAAHFARGQIQAHRAGSCKEERHQNQFELELEWHCIVALLPELHSCLVVAAEELVVRTNGGADHYRGAWGNTPGGKKSEMEVGDTDPSSHLTCLR